ncbi:glycoside hydrolase family 9 protein [uncultured Bacteroides sp.]|uniref:glycoside hydrolase family 9 protein n=1 Tax=uncultured Bacteroides sp. TaxID=162156 RepID=UPI002AA8FF72|nr:glycoside hydrolase family 9 protein [uncultured Bacteroides sp.]
MKRFILFILLSLLVQILIQAQSQTQLKPDAELAKQLKESNYVHHIMKPNLKDAGLTRWYKKEVLKSRELPLAEDFTSLIHTGPGTIHLDRNVTISGKGSVRLDTPASLGKKNPTNRNYATPEIIRPLNREDLREYNRFSVWVYVDAPGVYLTFAGLTLYNEGKKVMPTPGRFEGQHFETVYPNKWQHIIWEIPDLYRDCVTGFSVNIMLAGAPSGASEQMSLYVDDMRIEKVKAENSRGFDLRQNAIAYSHSGYKSGARKQALVQYAKQSSFCLHDANTGQVVYKGIGEKSDKGFLLLDFSDFNKSGQYTIAIDDLASNSFAIGDNAYLATAWHTLNFFYSERCGYDQPCIHQECHQDVFVYHPDGRSLSISGGWHDAADLTQGTGNTAESGIALLEMASAVQGKDSIFYERLLEEARWGLNWVMRTRFGDGYRIGGLIIGIWTKNIRGDKDDMQAEALNTPSDNLKAASYCALAVPHFEKTDPIFARWCRNCAIEDFQFAIDLLDTQRSDNNEVDLYALATVTAMRLYRLTQKQFYLDWAVRLAHTVMACQQLEKRTDWKIPLRGFFYESSQKKRILAYYHQSQEHLMVEGLSMLLTDAPNHADAPLWKASCKAYADYLHDISHLIAPYEILPSAIYELNNTDYKNLYHEGDQVGFPTMEEYNAQVRNGIPLSKNFYLRRFPVAYQFRGFFAVIMGKAKAAFILSRLLKDKELKYIATRQLEYIVGYNPFAMSTIYGDGYDYPPLYGAYAGNVVGAVPVGIETFENDDEPYFPMQNNCTYKEIWTHTTARVMWLIAELFK